MNLEHLDDSQLVDSVLFHAESIEQVGLKNAAQRMRDLAERFVLLARRDWAVRVLGAWSRAREGWWLCQHRNDFTVSICDLEKVWDGPRLRFEGATDDATRLAAAEAVLGELPESVRRELGPKP